MHKTVEEIAREAEGCTDPKFNRRKINHLFLMQDESHLWPIMGRFNVTKRAVNRAREFISESGQDLTGLEYASLLDSIMVEIVNNSVNW